MARLAGLGGRSWRCRKPRKSKAGRLRRGRPRCHPMVLRGRVLCKTSQAETQEGREDDCSTNRLLRSHPFLRFTLLSIRPRTGGTSEWAEPHPRVQPILHWRIWHPTRLAVAQPNRHRLWTCRTRHQVVRKTFYNFSCTATLTCRLVGSLGRSIPNQSLSYTAS